MNKPEIDDLWDYANPQKSEQKFRKLLADCKEEATATYCLNIQTQIARSLGLQKQFIAAHQELDSVSESLGNRLTEAHIRYELERGRVFNSSQYKAMAKVHFRNAYHLSLDYGNDFYAIDSAHMLAIVADPKEAMQWNLSAVKLAESSEETRARQWMSSLLNNIAWSYHDQKKYTNALPYFERALQGRLKQGSPRGIFIAKWCKARCLRSMNKLPDSLKIQRALLKEMESGKSAVDGYVYQEMQACLTALGKDKEAAFYAEKTTAFFKTGKK